MKANLHLNFCQGIRILVDLVLLQSMGIIHYSIVRQRQDLKVLDNTEIFQT